MMTELHILLRDCIVRIVFPATRVLLRQITPNYYVLHARDCLEFTFRLEGNLFSRRVSRRIVNSTSRIEFFSLSEGGDVEIVCACCVLQNTA